MINPNLIAESLADNNGCGLHSLTGSLIANLRNGKLDPASNDLLRASLSELLQYYKFRRINNIHDTELPRNVPLPHVSQEEVIEFANRLRNMDPVESTNELSLPMRDMLIPEQSSANARRPGTFLTDVDVCRLANRFGIRVESYSPLVRGEEFFALFQEIYGTLPANEQMLNLEYNFAILAIKKFRTEQLRLAEISEAEKQARIHAPISEEEINAAIQMIRNRNMQMNRLEDLAQPTVRDPNAPVLQLFNEHGNHWERIYNDEDSEEANLRACQAHNLHIRRRLNEVAGTYGAETQSTKSSNATSTTSAGTDNFFGPLQGIVGAFGQYCQAQSGGKGGFLGLLGTICAALVQILGFVANMFGEGNVGGVPGLFANLFGNGKSGKPGQDTDSSGSKAPKPSPTPPAAPSPSAKPGSSSPTPEEQAEWNARWRETDANWDEVFRSMDEDASKKEGAKNDGAKKEENGGLLNGKKGKGLNVRFDDKPEVRTFTPSFNSSTNSDSVLSSDNIGLDSNPMRSSRSRTKPVLG